MLLGLRLRQPRWLALRLLQPEPLGTPVKAAQALPHCPQPCPAPPPQDVTLLHFRKTGNRFATALLGLRIPDDEVSRCYYVLLLLPVCQLAVAGALARRALRTAALPLWRKAWLPQPLDQPQMEELVCIAPNPSLPLSPSLLQPQMEEFEATLEQFRSGLEQEFVFTPLSEREREVFSLFI